MLKYIGDFSYKNGYPPSLRQIMEGTGIKSTATVYKNLRILRELGYIDFKEGASRTVRLTDKWNEDYKKFRDIREMEEDERRGKKSKENGSCLV